MSKPLEELLAENTAAMRELTVEMKAANAGRGEAIAAIRETGAAGKGATATKAKDKPATQATETAATTTAATSAGLAREMSVDDFRKAIGDLVTSDDKTVKEARLDYVKNTLNPHFGGVAKIVDIKPEQYAEAIAKLTEFVNSQASGGAEDEDGIG